MAFKFENFDIEGLVEVKPDVYPDGRGAFSEMFKSSEFVEKGINVDFKQINRSSSTKNVLRGLHYQLPPKAQGKLMSVTAGEIYDVAVDIRKNSPTFGKWVGVNLSSEKRNMFYVPAGFAHGFCVLSEKAEIIYYCTDEYAPELERGIAWNDPALGIDWPTSDPILSDKDKEYKNLSETPDIFEKGVV